MPGTEPKKTRKAGSGQPKSQKYRPAKWGATAVHEVAVPSGDLVLAKILGPTEMIRTGMLAKFDVLSSIVQTDHIDRVEGRSDADLSPAERQRRQNQELASLMRDPEKLLGAMDAVDVIVCACVVEPKVHPVPVPIPDPGGMIDPDTKEPLMVVPDRVVGQIYVDSIPWDDRMFLFQWTLGGTSDLDRFREGLDTAMDGISAVEGDGQPTESASGD